MRLPVGSYKQRRIPLAVPVVALAASIYRLIDNLVFVLIPLHTALTDEILSDIASIHKDEALYCDKNFVLRQQAIDDIEFHIIDRIDALLQNSHATDLLISLKQYAERVKHRLEEVDRRLFHQLRTEISKGSDNGKLLAQWIHEFLGDQVPVPAQDPIGYDSLDMFINELLTYQDMPAETKDREPEMVYYQQTPARIILELVKRAAFKPNDVFFDLGSGLGQVVILVNLLTAVISKGVEFEPAFCNYANTHAADLHLKRVDFINMDARYADYTSGTVFFMYTPFSGKMLDDVLQNLSGEAKKRTIKIFTYGPCTLTVSRQTWLTSVAHQHNFSGRLAEFHSI